MSRSKLLNSHALATSVAPLILLLPLWVISLFWYEEYLRKDYQEQLTTKLAPVQKKLEQMMNQRLELLNNIRAFVELGLSDEGNDVLKEEGQLFLQYLYRSENGIHNLSIALGDTDLYVYPVHGIQKVPESDQLPDGRGSVKRSAVYTAMQPEVSISGPYNLKQGGTALYGQLAILVEDQLRGVISLAIDTDYIIRQSGISWLAEDYDISIRNSSGNVFYGTKTTFNPNAITLANSVGNDIWQIAAQKQGGPQVPLPVRLTQFTVLLLILMVAYVFFMRSTREKYLNISINKATGELQKRTAMLKSLIDSIPDMIYFKDQNNIYMGCNKAFSDYVGLDPNEISGSTDPLIFSSESLVTVLDNDYVAYQSLSTINYEKDVILSDGTHVTLDVIKTPFYDGDGSHVGAVVICRDITKLKETELALEKRASQDALTELPNRRIFNDRLSQEMAKARRNDNSVALFFLDLDHFKEINDTMGHEAGDQLLVQVAKRLQEQVREGDTVARIGGDEFVIIMGQLHDRKYVAVLAQKIIESFSGLFKIEGNEISIRASVGVSLFPGDASDPGTMLRNADAAMYMAKRSGRNCYKFYS